jgi:hypothetical protein
MATKLKIEKRGDEIIPLEMHFLLDRIIDNVSYYSILFSTTVMCGFYFSSTVA